MPFAGYLVSTGQLSLIGVATAGALGCNVGSTIAYYVAAYGGRPVLERWGEYILISPAEIKRADEFFVRYGSATVFFGRLLPVVRTFIAFPAGLARMPMLKFQVVHVPRLLAVVLCARLHRLCAGRALELGPDASQAVPRLRCGHRRRAGGRLCLVRLVALARETPILSSRSDRHRDWLGACLARILTLFRVKIRHHDGVRHIAVVLGGGHCRADRGRAIGRNDRPCPRR